METLDIDQLYELRVKKGMLPTIDIAGHTFYVDLRMDKLRPKDDFLSNGIFFSDIENYFDDGIEKYVIPYNPITREFVELDDQITEYPKDLIAISFPHQYTMDPFGFNRQIGADLKDGLPSSGLRLNFTAKIVPWKETFVAYLIESNKNDATKKPSNNSNTEEKASKKKRKGKKI
ncbi:hypothetical protein [Pedobacter sp. KLB.chiD]|uniref:hypothetical protein n=1 Tax=Pedobacter sp. KLB.chiD TaxID=3387402 RepID=UPI00399A5C9D